jgi:hypothetical protein
VVSIYLKKSGIQKWRCKKSPRLDNEKAAARLQWPFNMIISLLLTGNAGFGLTSVQLSVEKEANGTLYSESARGSILLMLFTNKFV